VSGSLGIGSSEERLRGTRSLLEKKLRGAAAKTPEKDLDRLEFRLERLRLGWLGRAVGCRLGLVLAWPVGSLSPSFYFKNCFAN
jgi:hypothetical protein